MSDRTPGLTDAQLTRIRTVLTAAAPRFYRASGPACPATDPAVLDPAVLDGDVLDVDVLVAAVAEVAIEIAREHTAAALEALADDLDGMPADQLGWSPDQTLGYTAALDDDTARLRAAAAALAGRRAS